MVQFQITNVKTWGGAIDTTTCSDAYWITCMEKELMAIEVTGRHLLFGILSII